MAAASKHHHWKPTTYSAHECGKRSFKYDSARQYAEAYGVSASWLFDGPGGRTHDPLIQTRNVALAPVESASHQSIVAPLAHDVALSSEVSANDLHEELVERVHELLEQAHRVVAAAARLARKNEAR